MIVAISFILIACIISIAVLWLVIKKYGNDNTSMRSDVLTGDLGGDWFQKLKKENALRHALNKDIDPNQYSLEELVEQRRKDLEEEGIQAAISKLGLTREQAIAQGLTGKFSVEFESIRRQLSTRFNREIDTKEALRITREEMEAHLIENPPTYPGPDCLIPYDIEYYLEKGLELPPEMASHVASCSDCSSIAITLESFSKDEQERNKPPGPDCVSQAKLQEVMSLGVLTNIDQGHLATCKRCAYQVHLAQNIYIQKRISEPDQVKVV